jgi:hypothetical protein
MTSTCLQGVRLIRSGGAAVSVQQFLVAVKVEKLSEGDAKWFPRWLDRYTQWTFQKGPDKVVIRTESLIERQR